MFAFLTKPHTIFVSEKAMIPPEKFRDGGGEKMREIETVYFVLSEIIRKKNKGKHWNNYMGSK